MKFLFEKGGSEIRNEIIPEIKETRRRGSKVTRERMKKEEKEDMMMCNK
jgi:hypothetical protein